MGNKSLRQAIKVKNKVITNSDTITNMVKQ